MRIVPLAAILVPAAFPSQETHDLVHSLNMREKVGGGGEEGKEEIEDGEGHLATANGREEGRQIEQERGRWSEKGFL